MMRYYNTVCIKIETFPIRYPFTNCKGYSLVHPVNFPFTMSVH